MSTTLIAALLLASFTVSNTAAHADAATTIAHSVVSAADATRLVNSDRLTGSTKSITLRSSVNGCFYMVGAFLGELKCGTELLLYQWADGHWEAFGLGTDGVVYHIWQRHVGDSQWSGWHSLGGYQIANGVFFEDHAPTIRVTGGNGYQYCKSWLPGWGAWYLCEFDRMTG